MPFPGLNTFEIVICDAGKGEEKYRGSFFHNQYHILDEMCEIMLSLMHDCEMQGIKQFCFESDKEARFCDII